MTAKNNMLVFYLIVMKSYIQLMQRGHWRLLMKQKNFYDSLKKKSTKQYGDEYESGKSDNPAEYARWSSDSSIINISLTDDDLNGNKVSINIRKE